MNMQTKSMKKEYIKFVSQNILGMMGFSCYVLADTFFISKAAGVNGITVLNLCLPVYSLIFAIGSMLGVGSATRFSILREQSSPEMGLYFSNAVFWTFIISVPFMVGGLCLPGRILQIMGGDADIVALGTSYTKIFLVFTPFFMLNYIVNAFVRNDDAPFLAMAATLSGSIFNIVFDYIFMFPMHMGMAGAALATAVSPVVSICICSIHFMQKKNGIRFLWSKPGLTCLARGCRLGTSAFVGEFSSSVTTVVFNFLILDLAGNVGVAAYGVIANLAIVATAIFNGIAEGSQPLISTCYGRGDIAGTRKLLRYGMITAVGFALLIYVVIFVGTDFLIDMFNSERSGTLAELAAPGMRIYFAGFLFAGINIVAIGYHSASNQAKTAAVSSASRGIIAIIVCAVILGKLFGMKGVWLAFPAAELITGLILGGMSGRNHVACEGL